MSKKTLERTDKIEEAQLYLDAMPDGVGYRYYAQETQEWYRVSEEELLKLWEYLHASEGEKQGYSLWCASGYSGVAVEMCAYCDGEVFGVYAHWVPKGDDDYSWEVLAGFHDSDCEWILTRAHSKDV